MTKDKGVPMEDRDYLGYTLGIIAVVYGFDIREEWLEKGFIVFNNINNSKDLKTSCKK